MRSRLAALAAFGTLAASFPLGADYDAGLRAYQQGDYYGAYAQWIRTAAGEDGGSPPAIQAESQYALGMLYWYGQGVTQNTASAAVWLQEAAELNHPGAQSKLGYLYLTGQGVNQSEFEAFKWLQMAAQQEDPDAQYNLAVMYRDGLGLPQDLAQAKEWFTRAASNGDRVSAGVLEQWPDDQAPAVTDGATGLAQQAGEEVASDVPEVQEGTESAVPEALEDEPAEAIATAVPTPSAASGSTALESESWIAERNPEHYTIQVIALRNTTKISEFAASQPDWAPFAVYQQKLNDLPLYVLIQGDYASLEEARQAKENFPQGLQAREELWIRKFLMVQGLLQ